MKNKLSCKSSSFTLMNKTRILLSSVLKPINDNRMFEKLGLSLSKLPETEVHICGFKAPVPAAPANVFFYPLNYFSRLSLTRLSAQFKYFCLLFRVKPQVIIIGTHELLLISLLYKLTYACHLIYDVQENYYLNISRQPVYPRFIRHLIAAIIRTNEILASCFIKAFFVAEESYVQELPFLKNKYLVLQNKYKPSAQAKVTGYTCTGKVILPESRHIRLLYSGTISELNGIYEAIELCELLYKINPAYTLTIIGNWHLTETGRKVRAFIKNKPYINLIGGDYLVPHTQIIEAVGTSHVGLLPYHPHVSISRCIPTKLFEYLANALPMIIRQNVYWDNIINSYQAGLIIDYRNYNAAAINQQLLQTTFYQHISLEPAYWNSEEQKLSAWFKSTILK